MSLKENQKKAAKKILTVVGIILYAVIFLITLTVNIVWIYLQRNPLDEIVTAEVNYVSKMTDEDGEERYFLEINYWQNNDERGVEAFEFCMNAYTDYQFGAIKGQGIQFINNTKYAGLNNVKNWNKYYYSRQESLAWSAMTSEEIQSGADGTKFYVNLSGQPYLCVLDGVKGVDYVINSANTATKFLENVFNPITALANIVSGKYFAEDTWIAKDEIKNYFTLDDYYFDIATNLTKSNVGAGSYSMSLVEMTKYFNFYKVDANGVVSNEACNADFYSSFFEVKVNVYSSGLRGAADSSYGMVAKDAKWSISGLEHLQNEYAGRDQMVTYYASDFVFYKYNNINAICPVLKTSNKVDTSYSAAICIDFSDNYLRNNTSTQNLLILDNLLGDISVSQIELKFYSDSDVYVYYYSSEIAEKIEVSITPNDTKIHFVKIGG